jgi:hypothetical protein
VNLRILKKLSKRAAPLLPLLEDAREQFRAERYDNYTGLIIRTRKHWERGRSPHNKIIREGEIKYPARDGKGGYIYLHPPSHPRKGTIMVGAVSGYYEPEWDEETAWEALSALVYASFTDWDEDGPRPLRSFNGPGDIFRAAAELIVDGELMEKK